MYLQDLPPGVYSGPTIAAEEVANSLPDQRSTVRIMDVACGTGLVGKHVCSINLLYSLKYSTYIITTLGIFEKNNLYLTNGNVHVRLFLPIFNNLQKAYYLIV